MKNRILSAILSYAIVLTAGCSSTTSQTQPTNSSQQTNTRNVVVWLSIDGLRHDYVVRDADHLSTLNRLMHEGESTQAMMPIFPSITWASHVAEATGAPAAETGIMNNAFRDTKLKQTFNMPGDSSLIEAEPIWITAPRQHVRTAVMFWPMCAEQTGAVKSDYSVKYSAEENDAQRLQDVLKTWRDDDATQHDGQPLRLIMGYVSGIDTAGHKFGPDAPETRDTLRALDQHLGEFFAQAQEIFTQKMKPGDHLYFIITTDHGMSPLKEQLVMDDFIGADLANGAHIVNGGSCCNIYLDDIDPAQRAARADAIVAKLKGNDKVQAWKRDELPKEYRYNNPTRTGDVVATAKIGYSWRNKPKNPSTRPAIPGSSMKGNHGYWVGDNPDMLGFALIYSPQTNFGGKDLGRVDSLRFEPTVAKLLGISPSPKARGEPISVK